MVVVSGMAVAVPVVEAPVGEAPFWPCDAGGRCPPFPVAGSFFAPPDEGLAPELPLASADVVVAACPEVDGWGVAVPA